MKGYDRKIYKHRNQIERYFGRIKSCRLGESKAVDVTPLLSIAKSLLAAHTDTLFYFLQVHVIVRRTPSPRSFRSCALQNKMS